MKKDNRKNQLHSTDYPLDEMITNYLKRTAYAKLKPMRYQYLNLKFDPLSKVLQAGIFLGAPA